MALTIVIHTNDAANQAPELALTFDSTRIAIGRSKSCDLWLPDPSVAKRHASIRRESGKTLVIDEGSVNGIVVDHVKLPAHAPVPLVDGSFVRVGRVWLEIRTAGGMSSTQAEVRRVALAIVKRDLERNHEPSIATLAVLTAADTPGDRLSLDDHGREYVLGRGRDADLTLADELVSRRHAAVSFRGEGWSVRDLASKRGSLLRATKDSTSAPTPLDGEPRLWRSGEVLQVGTTRIELCDPVAQALEESLAATELKMQSEEFREPPPGARVVGAQPLEAAETQVNPPQTEEAHDATEDDPENDPEGPTAGDEPLAREKTRETATLDAAVVLVALGLLAISLAGLAWVLR